MPTVGAVERQLILATGLRPAHKESRQDFLFRVMTVINRLNDWGWSNLSIEAQDWQNEAMVTLDAIDERLLVVSKEDRKTLRILLEKYSSGVVQDCLSKLKFKHPPRPKLPDFPKDPKPLRSKKWSATPAPGKTKPSKLVKKKSRKSSRSLTKR